MKDRPAWQQGKFNGVGGKLKALEAPAAGMVREFAEETGINSNPIEWRHFATMRCPVWSVYCFAVYGFPIHEGKRQPGETESVHEIPLHALADNPRMFVPNLQWLIPLALCEEGVHGHCFVDVAYQTDAP